MPIPNTIRNLDQYPGYFPGAIQKQLIAIGVENVAYGPTLLSPDNYGYGQTGTATNFWAGHSMSLGTYTVYKLRGTTGPSIRVAVTESDLPNTVQQFGLTATTVVAALLQGALQTDMLIANFNYENIVTNALAINVDCAFSGSVPRQGQAPATVNNLCGLSYSGSSIGGIGAALGFGTASGLTATGQVVTFADGQDCKIQIDDYVVSAADSVTVELWTKLGVGTNKTLCSFGTFSISTCDDGLAYTYDNGVNSFGITDITVAALGLTSSFNQLTFKFNSNDTFDTFSMYVNGATQSLVNVTGTAASLSLSTISNSCIIGSASTSSPMQLSSFKLYDRELTHNEILQNYSAFQVRF